MPPTVPSGPDAAAQAVSRQLTALIRAEMEQAGGWLGFARYMELALTAPGLGYYSAGQAVFGAGGDFVTAPELTPLFGHTVARTLAQVLPDTEGTVLELGAGSGRLAASVLQGLAALEAVPARYLILEVSPALQARQRATLAELAPQHLDRVDWVSQLPERISGVVLANEVLDALPVHALHWCDGQIMERGVACSADGSLAWCERPLTDASLLAQARALAVPEPYHSEISLLTPAWTRSLAAALEHGLLLLIDYGFGRAEYYHPQRNQGTLRCFTRHRVHGDPFWMPGLQDITAHVDFTAVADAALDQGMELAGFTTQGQYLMQAGILDALAVFCSPEHAHYPATSHAVQTLLSPAEMGELFKVIAFTRGLEGGALPGFARGDQRHRLG